MKIFKFKFPGFSKDEVEHLPLKYKGQPIGRILDVEETKDGLIITGQFNEDIAEEPAFKHMFFNTDELAAFSLGPVLPPDTLSEYSAKDAELTMALFQTNREGREMDAYDSAHGWIKPGTRMGCATVILASLGLWVVIYFLIHWLFTGQAFPIFEW